MSRLKCIFLAFACFAIAAAIRPITVAVAGDSGKGGVASRILVVQSYNPEYVWTQQIEKGLRDALAGVAVDVDVVYLDAKRRPDPDVQRAAARKVLRALRPKPPRSLSPWTIRPRRILSRPFSRGGPAPGCFLWRQRPSGNIRISRRECHRGARALPFPGRVRVGEKDRAPGQTRRLSGRGLGIHALCGRGSSGRPASKRPVRP